MKENLTKIKMQALDIRGRSQLVQPIRSLLAQEKQKTSQNKGFLSIQLKTALTHTILLCHGVSFISKSNV